MSARLQALRALQRWRQLAHDRAQITRSLALRDQRIGHAALELAQARLQAALTALDTQAPGQALALDYRQSVGDLAMRLSEIEQTRRRVAEAADAAAEHAAQAHQDARRASDKATQRCAEAFARTRVDAELRQFDQGGDLRLARVQARRERP